MNVLGIETSCDETSAAVVQDGKKVLSNEISSSLRFHKLYGGIVPEIASRKQLESITPVAREAFIDSGLKFKDINLVAVTSGPGLLGSLLVGISFAKSLALSLNVPLLGVNHLYSHIYANFLDRERIRLPFIALVVSGGHTSLFYVEDFDAIKLLGSTCDDACGEAFDKVAKILGLSYPGGPLIEKLARKGDAGRIKFACSGTGNPLDFSFSGIKTAVLYYVRKHKELNSRLIADIAASFQESVIEAIVRKSLLACRMKNVKRIVVGGGVIANSRLREKFMLMAKEEGLNCYFPPKELSLDNAAMVAGFAYQLYKSGNRSGLYLSALLN